MAEKAILFDTTKCIACRGCQVACKQWNGLQGEATRNSGSYENPSNLGPDTWIKIRFNEVSRGESGAMDWLFTRQSCMHCSDAPCVEVCPTGALYHHELGFVAYDREICSGCGYCVEFCPFSVPHMRGARVSGMARAEKCVMCQDRITNGYEPSCVKTCPANALVFGNRDDLVIKGKLTVRELKAKYPGAYLYGEREMGGTHVLYILTDSPEAHGLPASPEVPASAIAWKGFLQPVGAAIVGITIVGLGLNYLVARAFVKREKN